MLDHQSPPGSPGQTPVAIAVSDAVQRWRRKRALVPRADGSEPLTPASPSRPALNAVPTLEDVLRPIPRRQTLIAPSPGDAASSTTRPLTFEAGLGDCLKRLVLWLGLVVRLLAGVVVDKLRGTDTVDRRAKRLRQGLERVGGTFVKFGQQISMRIDVVRWEYCVELSKMLDRMSPFPTEQALAAIERAAGKPWQEVFSTFDPEPVGAASIACVYQAVLKDGTKVAVKVRRPTIGTIFMADFRVLDWLFALIEGLTILRPGFTANLRQEFRDTLLEELDFRKEARFQHIFRQNARQTGRHHFFTAPRVHFELSNHEVIVQEFVAGMWLWEVIAAVEQRDPNARALMRELNIDPGIVARRILWASFWSMDENLFFHADPHPANIVVGADNSLTFIDFGSCGSFNNEQRWIVRRLSQAMQAGDTEGMARATMRLIEPFPPLDISLVVKEAQEEFTRVLATFRTKAKYTEWWERTTAKQWLAMTKVARKYNLPFHSHTLRMMRASLLFDTIVMRLDRSVDRYAEHRKFIRDQGRWARKRWRRRVRDAKRQLLLSADTMLDTGGDLLDRAQQTLSSPIAKFSSMVDKVGFAFSVLTKMIGRMIGLTAAAAGVVATAAYLRTGAVRFSDTASAVLTSTSFRIVIALMFLLHMRHIVFRSMQRDIRRHDRG